MERPRTLDPTECKHAIRHLNGTHNPQLDAFNYSNSFTFFNDIQKQRLLETKQPPFRITKLNIYHYGAFLMDHQFTISIKLNSERKSCLLGPL